MNQFKQWQEHDLPLGKQALILGIGALIFPTGIPALLVFLLPQLDERMGIDPFYFGSINITLGLIGIITGGFLAFWAIISQIKLASGTPFPMMPTQKLLIIGPFKYCRNPMTLGTLTAYAGAAIWVGSFTSMLAVIVLAILLIAYLKLIEEKELSLRFGEEYLEYKKTTPFILPIAILKENKYQVQ